MGWIDYNIYRAWLLGGARSGLVPKRKGRLPPLPVEPLRTFVARDADQVAELAGQANDWAAARKSEIAEGYRVARKEAARSAQEDEDLQGTGEDDMEPNEEASDFPIGYAPSIDPPFGWPVDGRGYTRRRRAGLSLAYFLTRWGWRA